MTVYIGLFRDRIDCELLSRGVGGEGGGGGNFRIFVTGCVAGKSKTKSIHIMAKPKKHTYS